MAPKPNFNGKFHAFTQTRTYPSGTRANSMDIWARLVQKIPLFLNFGTKCHLLLKFLKQPLVSFGIILHKKLLQNFEVQTGGFSKNSPFKLGNDGHFF